MAATTSPHGGVGSKRYRVTFKGPGGHSYGAFGLVNPAFAMGNAIQKFARLKVPATPKTTFNVGVMGGGTSVNSIPFESWMEVDMRSESRAELEKLRRAFIGAVQQAVDEENETRSTTQGRITVDLKLIGDRPSGETPRDSLIVQTAAAVVRAIGMTPTLQLQQHGLEHPDQPGHSRRSPSIQAAGRPRPRARRVDRRRKSLEPARDSVRAGPASRARRRDLIAPG